jgi:hypothetical protein
LNLSLSLSLSLYLLLDLRALRAARERKNGKYTGIN